MVSLFLKCIILSLYLYLVSLDLQHLILSLARWMILSLYPLSHSLYHVLPNLIK